MGVPQHFIVGIYNAYARQEATVTRKYRETGCFPIGKGNKVGQHICGINIHGFPYPWFAAALYTTSKGDSLQPLSFFLVCCILYKSSLYQWFQAFMVDRGTDLL